MICIKSRSTPYPALPAMMVPVVAGNLARADSKPANAQA